MAVRIAASHRRLAHLRETLVRLATPLARRLDRHLLLRRDAAAVVASGLFDRDWYLARNRDVAATGIDPLYHYLRFGGPEGRDPGPGFSGAWYLSEYPDVGAARANPLVHYVRHGAREGRQPRRGHLLSRSVTAFLADLPAVLDGVVFLSHDASRTGAPINLLGQCAAYRAAHGENFVVLALSGGGILEDFRATGPTLCLDRTPPIAVDGEVRFLFRRLRELGYTRCVANTVVSGALAEVLAGERIATVYEVHELPALIDAGGFAPCAAAIARSGAPVVFAARFVADRFVERFGLPRDRVRILPQGVRDAMVFRGDAAEARRRLCRRLGIRPTDRTRIALGAGTASLPKGTDLFLRVPEELAAAGRLGELHVVWLGKRDATFEDWRVRVLPRLAHRRHVHFLDFEPDPACVFAAADVFLLTSREDSFPSVALEAMANRVPVVAFGGCGGIPEIIDGRNGAVVAPFDVRAMGLEALRILGDPALARPTTAALPTYPAFVEGLLALFPRPAARALPGYRVTAVVPSYNHERHLEERLRSILAQTHPPAEILFLDDASRDGSVPTAERILGTGGIPYRIVANDVNRGPFRQWVAGLEAGDGEFVWFAEADDVAAPDLLATLLPAFEDPEVALAYCQSRTIDEDSVPHPGHSYVDDTRDLSPRRWLLPYVEKGAFEAANFLAIRNTIPNASAVVLRREALAGIGELLPGFRYAGDWFAYLYALRRRKIAYHPRVMNYHRRHRGSAVTAAAGNAAFFGEVARVMEYAVDTYRIAPPLVDRMEHSLRRERNAAAFLAADPAFFGRLRARARRRLRERGRLTVAIVLAEFRIGGGEITGLRLANHLARTHEVHLCAARPGASPSFLEMIAPEVRVLGADAAALRDLVHSGELDIVNSHVWWADKLAYSLLRDTSVFWILSMHGCYEMLRGNPAADPDFPELCRGVLARADHITYDAGKNLGALGEIGGPEATAKARLVYHGYEPPASPPQVDRRALGLAVGTFVFVFAARGIPEKGWEEAIAATAALRREGRDAALLLLGDGAYVRGLRERHRGEGHLRFLGETSRLRDYLALADCGVLPTYFVSESQPLTVIEYLAAGLPVIATDIGEIPGMLRSGDRAAGIVLPLVDGKVAAEDLAAAMRRVMDEPGRRAGYRDAAAEIFREKFDVERFARAYLSPYYRE